MKAIYGGAPQRQRVGKLQINSTHWQTEMVHLSRVKNRPVKVENWNVTLLTSLQREMTMPVKKETILFAEPQKMKKMRKQKNECDRI